MRESGKLTKTSHFTDIVTPCFFQIIVNETRLSDIIRLRRGGFSALMSYPNGRKKLMDNHLKYKRTICEF